MAISVYGGLGGGGTRSVLGSATQPSATQPATSPASSGSGAASQLAALLGGSGGGGIAPVTNADLGMSVNEAVRYWRGQSPGVGSGGGGGGGGLPASQIPPMNTNVQANPDISGLMGEMSDYQAAMGAGSDVDAINAMQRQRDLMSGMSREFQENALSRGMSPGSASLYGQRQGIAGLQSLGGLNAALASDARAKQMEMLGQRGNLAVGQANISQGQQNFLLSQWQAQQQAALQAAQLQQQQQQQQYQNQMGMISQFLPLIFAGV